jgi:hypothetical protein
MAELYSKVRQELKTGDLLAWKTTKINSFFDFVLFLYQKILKAEYTHVGIVVKEGNRFFLIEATPPVVRLFPVSLCDDFYHFSLGIEYKSSQVDLLLRTIGKKYGLMDLIRSILRLGDNPSEYYCSELASHFYNSVGYIHDERVGLTPDKLIEAVAKVKNTTPTFVKIDKGNLNGV